MNLDIRSWITGFVDGEGCFSVSFSEREKLNVGIEVRPSFSVGQSAPSTLELIKTEFGVGGIRYSKADNCYKYEARSSKDLQDVVIPHFRKYPLHTAKKNDFLKFEKVLGIIKKNQHLSIDGMKSILDIVFADNASLRRNRTPNRSYTKEQLLKLLRS